MAAERELGVDPLLDGGEPELLEPLRLDAREPLELEIRERSSVPERLGGPQRPRRRGRVTGRERLAALGDQPLEVLQIELARLDAEEIAAAAGGETRLVRRRRAQHLPEPRDVVAQGVVGRVEALLGEELVDQPLARDDPVRAQQEQRQQRALLRPAGRDRHAVHPHRERAEDPELQAARCHLAPSSLKGRGVRAKGPGRVLGQLWDNAPRRSRSCCTRPSASGPA